VRDGLAPSTPPSFESSSPTLAEVVRDINKYSNNVMAQQLFLTLGLTQRGAGTPAAARAVLREWAAQRFGSDAATLVVDNGSGLSRESRVSAQLLTRLLLAVWASPVMPELLGSLPVSGVDGTLGPRRAAPRGPIPAGDDAAGVSGSSPPRSPATLGRAHLKTGSLRDVAGIAGVVLADSGRRYVVVAIANHPNANAARPALAALLQWAANDATAPVTSAGPHH
jgi:D-alanyl-D-alanine carboxypeptidase/D-alanyl-D-alanine-endopeptidase (penicillin-binding protein 4)